MSKILCSIILLFFMFIPWHAQLHAQSSLNFEDPVPEEPAEEQTEMPQTQEPASEETQFMESQERRSAGTEAVPEFPSGFSGVELGMEIETVKEILKESVFFNYRGDPDVSLLPKENQSLIDSGGFSYVDRGLFQFNEKKLFTIIIYLNKDEMDYFTLFTSFSEKYGEPDFLDPSSAIWDSENVRIALEKPLTIKYVDKTVFEKLKNEDLQEDSMREISRERFLEMF